MRFARHAAFAGTFFLIALPAPAQDEDGGGMIQRFLQDKLSSGGREVRISGFEGLLSGAARLGELTIADDKGVWLTLRNAELDWSRAALLRGNLSVETLSAGELIVERLPEAAPQDENALPDAPKAEASGFSLPELPISIRIDTLAIERAELGEPVLGQAAVLGLQGGVELASGEGRVDLETRRLDGPDDTISLHGSFVNETRTLTLDLSMSEDAGGIVSSLLKLPGSPSLDLKVAGDGPLTDFAADIGLRTDEQDRIAGAVTLKGDDAGNTTFTADIGGDITPLIPADFHEFFGDDIRLTVNGARGAEGTLDLPLFSLAAKSLQLQGAVTLGADGLPTAFDIDGKMGRADGAPLRLPVSGPGTYLDQVALAAEFDAAQSDRWTLTAEVDGVDTEAANLDQLALDGVGRISTGDGAAVSGDLLFDFAGLALADPALAKAAGETLNGGVAFSWQQGSALDITRLFADGADFGVTILGDLRVADRSLKISGQGQVRADDISRFSDLAGRPLTGQATVGLSGQGDPLGGIFAVTADIAADGLSIGDETADRLLDGPVTIATAARRDTSGTVLDRFELRSRGVEADASGNVGSGSSDLRFSAALSDVGLVLPGHEGQLTLSGEARETAPGDWMTGLELAGPYELAGNLAGRIHPGDGDITLDLSMPDIAPLVPDHSGPISVTGSAKEEAEGKWNVDLDVGGPYELAAQVAGLVAPGESDVALEIALPDIAPLVPDHSGPISVTGSAKEEAEGKWNVDLDVGGPYELAAQVAGLVAPGESDVALEIALPDIAPLVPGHTGAVALSGTAAETGTGGWKFKLDGSGPYEAQVNLDGSMGGGPGEVALTASLPDIAPLAPGLTGPILAEGTASDAGDGLWKIDFDASGPYDSVATVDGVVGGGQSDLLLDVSLPDLSPLVPQVQGPVRARGTAAEAGDGRWNVDFNVAAPQGATADIAGAVGATGTDVELAVAVPQVSAFAPGVNGALTAAATAAQREDGAWELDLDANGPYSSTVAAGGIYGPGVSSLAVEAALPDVGALAPAYSGPLSIKGTANEASANTWNVVLDAGLPYDGTANIVGAIAAGATALDLQVNLPTIAPFAPGITGGFSATGNVAQSAAGYAVTLDTNGPQGVSSSVSGSVAADFATVALNATGTAPLGLANKALSPNIINGTAAFNIAVDGAPSLEAVSGTVTINGADMTLPEFRQNLSGINVQVGLDGSSVQLDASANSQAGGSLGANGSLQISGGMNANLQASLNQFVLTDPTLFSTTLDGGVTISGPLTGGANIDGRINVGRTEIRIPDGGLGFGGAVPNLTHTNEPNSVRQTRQRAGLIEEKKSSSSGSGGAGAVFGLNVTVRAPDEIFIRGRGLDTELGGGMVVTGTTATPKPVGEIEVIRGRLDILGQRLDVTEGTVSLAGGLQPYIDITASSSRDDFEFVAKITGPVDDPTFKLSSVPDLPQDEVLAYFLFGKSVTDLSALQAVQMASALATLTGRGGVGLMGNIREGLGLDDLDLATTDDGGAEVRAGKYISDNIYTEFVADSQGETEIDLNIDVSKNFTVKGTADSKGDSSIGIYFERDY
ncbi:translocation/assembly module TamB domain-containing protein [Aliiruegeria lutimaris]|uniref:Autotransporter secretion inner membrane protein TamB n=1 Tax=Aliiruegeria lutimaris TaxID=571298 RepID=A0A1G8PIK8_9RHOB|nr:translocation/assembly module TamB domain-containing protein [Aliiruegeria lutimaris]SDI92361.1 autotransporter secretion inner membrane protein TamB [Aliiruegeria lutimaris]